jgi:leucyl aminopeptidase
MTRKSSRKPQSVAPAKSRKTSKNSILNVSEDMVPVVRWVKQALAEGQTGKSKPGGRSGDRHGRVFIVPQLSNAAPGESFDAATRSWIAGHLEGVPAWQRENALKTRPESVMLADDQGPIWVLMPKFLTAGSGALQSGAFGPSAYGRTRDLVGACVAGFREYKLERITFAGTGCSREHWLGALSGLDLGTYRFAPLKKNGPDACNLPAIHLPAEILGDEALIDEAASLGFAMNVARHLVNLPANELNPTTYSSIVKKLFAGSRTSTVSVLDEPELAREGMNLLRAVGGASPNPPCLVHIRYRPRDGAGGGKSSKKEGRKRSRPIAIVGKGITFDTGGLDIKPSSGMRWMKKDMGGSATVVGVALYAEQMQIPVPLDFYLAIAENSVSGAAMRPGDVFKARNGLTVEISNTDAEGRLVMADAFDYALTRTGADEPELLIDASTLTGAMRVAVGLAISGMFSNDDKLAAACLAAGQKSGDPCWRLPLFDEYKTALKSQVADLSNCSDSSFGGAITAALFLDKFTRGKPWIHFDFYAWTDRAAGAMTESGGNAQATQLLINLIRELWRPSAVPS